MSATTDETQPNAGSAARLREAVGATAETEEQQKYEEEERPIRKEEKKKTKQRRKRCARLSAKRRLSPGLSLHQLDAKNTQFDHTTHSIGIRHVATNWPSERKKKGGQFQI
ncbi:hypothetical protein niasHT_035193 [Heterodera trifolii]|uniref:Uncharacterized protein n=1 Tax=Heterodera trifolii TaxID=157864 RepID=A0ABD2J856_9BILA